ncbi:MAG: CheY-like chemotaxis protein [Alteromonadaceae bacterium]|jgi:CheY-like chemotaxis protein
MKALVVDPSSFARMVINTTLESYGIVTDSVNGEKEATSLIEKNNYQLICVARTLETGDCRTFCAKLRANISTQSTPIVMLSVSDELEPESFMAFGITEIFSKNDITSFSSYVKNLNTNTKNNFRYGGRILYVEDTMSIAKLTTSVLNEMAMKLLMLQQEKRPLSFMRSKVLT